MSDENREPAKGEGDDDSAAKVDETEEREREPAAPKKTAKAKGKGTKARPAPNESVKDRNLRIREEAAARRRDRRQDEVRRAAPARNLDASEMVDDALARGTHNAAVWLKNNATLLQWLFLALIVGGVGYKIYSVRHDSAVGRSSDTLFAAVDAERARIGEAAAEPDRYTGLIESRKHFATEEARLKSAETAYAGALDNSGELGMLAKLGQAGILYDQAKYKEALQAYQAVRDSELASKDQDVKGRAIEGMGLSHEALGKLDDAQKSFRELQNSGITGFGALGQYHQARLFLQQGDKAKAKELVTKAIESLTEKEKARGPGSPPGYLASAARELLGVIDPNSATLSSTGMGKGMDPQQLEKLQRAAGGEKMTPEKLEELLKQMQGAPGDVGAAPEAPAPAPAPTPAPEAPASAAPALPEKAEAPAPAPAPSAKPKPKVRALPATAAPVPAPPPGAPGENPY